MKFSIALAIAATLISASAAQDTTAPDVSGFPKCAQPCILNAHQVVCKDQGPECACVTKKDDVQKAATACILSACALDSDKVLAASVGAAECVKLLGSSPPPTTPTAPASSVPTDVCVKKCTDALTDCQTQPEANESFCASNFAACIGYNPYSPSYVAPTACSTSASSTAAPTATASPTAAPTTDVCVKKCTDALTDCQTQPEANESFCASNFAACIGYNPYSPSYVAPTACATSSSASSSGTGGIISPTSNGTLSVGTNPASTTAVTAGAAPTTGSGIKMVGGLMGAVLGLVALI